MRLLVWLSLTSALFAQPSIDFSYAGATRTAPIATAYSVHPSGRDDTALVQAALDEAAAHAPAAVLLAPGRYLISGSLHIRTSGVVLRGAGDATLVATGKSRRTLIEIGATTDPTTEAPVNITDENVAAGSRQLHTTAALHPGDRVVITRPSTREWISALGMSGLKGQYANQRLDWLPGSRNLVWDRAVESVKSNEVTLDAPITTALERRYGGATIARVPSAPPHNIGIENVTFDSTYDSPFDEDHSWIAVALDHVEDAWVRNVTARHFAGSAVRVGQRARRISIEDCRNEAPISEAAGYRRQAFLVEGQQVLVRRCHSEQGMNDFATGLLAAGPNVFLDCTATRALGPSGSFESWASGVLYENVRIEGAGLWLTNDDPRTQGSGWTAANSVVWNSHATDIRVHGPEGAENIAKDSPEPLYEALLTKRLGRAPPKSPSADFSRLIAEFKPQPQPTKPAPATHRVEIVGGRFTVDGQVLWGGVVNDGWWRGQENPATAIESAGVAITRFIPGRTGHGLTEDLPALADQMVRQGTPFYQFIPGLWYDRRRDEHSTFSRTDANVWAPFYEMPWARTGKGRAADGLSLFDLSKFNPWYFSRLRDFGELATEHGLFLQYNIYNTHNVLEILPHWVDYPWRPANNVNDTGLAEPPPVEGTNRIHVANEVYDISNPQRRALHRSLVLHTLDELGDLPNVVFCTGFQFAGPLAFQEFFQDTVAEWEKRTGKTVRIELATSKDITDAILANPARARQVAVIDMRYWQYRPDGTLFAPQGGKNLAFREMIRAAFPQSSDTPPDTTPYQVYRQVREYHDRYPDKAIIALHAGTGPIPVLMAGGAGVLMRNPSGGQGQGTSADRTALDAFVHKYLARTLMRIQPRDNVINDPEQNWCGSTQTGDSVLIYTLAGPSIRVMKTLSDAQYEATWFDPRTGSTRDAGATLTALAGDEIAKPTSEPWLLLLRAQETAAAPAPAIRNPLLPSGPDPWVTYRNGFYYYMNTTGDSLGIRKTRSVADLEHAEMKLVWKAPASGPYSRHVWAPELHYLRGRWYIYFAADAGTNMTHRIWVLENSSPDPLIGDWTMKGKVADPSDKWAIDASLFEHNDRLYMIWSGWEGDVNGAQNIYIAELENPWTIRGHRVRISSPDYPWERVGDHMTKRDPEANPGLETAEPVHIDVNEGPEILKRGDKIFLVYSASACWSDFYSLGMLTASTSADLLNPASWQKSPIPVFWQSPKAGAYGPGHNSFFQSPDGKEDWIIYHANSKPNQGCRGDRSPRAQRFTWNPDGTPNFGRPVPVNR